MQTPWHFVEFIALSCSPTKISHTPVPLDLSFHQIAMHLNDRTSIATQAACKLSQSTREEK